MANWYEDHENLVSLATWINDGGGFDGESSIDYGASVIRLFEKPWKWGNEWKAFQSGIKFADWVESDEFVPV